VEQTLKTSGWPDASSSAVCLLAQSYVARVVEHDRVPVGTRIRLQVRLAGASCRLLFCSEGREWNSDTRWNDLRTRLQRTEAARLQTLFEGMATLSSGLYRRGHLNLGYFVIAGDLECSEGAPEAPC
jgi:hypothetical protein